jgi:hypothetical protein
MRRASTCSLCRRAKPSPPSLSPCAGPRFPDAMRAYKGTPPVHFFCPRLWLHCPPVGPGAPTHFGAAPRGVAGAPEHLGAAPRGVTDFPDHLRAAPRGVAGAPDRLGAAPRGVAGACNHLRVAPRGVAVFPDHRSRPAPPSRTGELHPLHRPPSSLRFGALDHVRQVRHAPWVLTVKTLPWFMLQPLTAGRTAEAALCTRAAVAARSVRSRALSGRCT